MFCRGAGAAGGIEARVLERCGVGYKIVEHDAPFSALAEAATDEEL